MRIVVAILAATCVMGLTVAQSNAATCHQLWVARNSIYKAAGYCFKTAAAISYFGNAGCLYDNEGDVPLSARQRSLINRIVAQERRQGCSD